MSGKAIGWALDQRIGNPTAKLVLVGYAEHADPHTWVCWPSRRTVGKYAEVELRQAHRLHAILVAEGLVEEVGPDELDDESRVRWEAIPVHRRPKLWRLTGYYTDPNAWGVTRDMSDVTGVSSGVSPDDTNGVSSDDTQRNLHKNRENARAGARDGQTRRDYLDADATTALLDEHRQAKAAAVAGAAIDNLRRLRGDAS